MSAKHTPGPWRADIGRHGEAHHVCVRGEVVASVKEGTLEALADAHLIAAAPDLLAALENLIGEQGHYFYCTHWHAGAEGKCSKRCIEIREAIAKATGASHD